MALDDLSSTYPGKAEAPSADYPQGRIRNDSTGSANDGTPTDEDWANDWQGFFGALLTNAPVTPSGSVDTATASDFYDAMILCIKNTLDSLSRPHCLNASSYRGQSFDVSVQSTSPSCVELNSDGTKFYIFDAVTDLIYQYSMSTAYDLSTASYDSITLNVSSQTTNGNKFKFGDSGSKLYLVDPTGAVIYQYNLSTAYDLSSASYASLSLSVSAQDTIPQDIAFNNAGTTLYVAGSATDVIYQYTLSGAWDISTGSYSSLSFDPTAITGSSIDWSLNTFETERRLYIGVQSGANPPYGTIFEFVLTASLGASTDFTGARYRPVEVVGSLEDYTISSDGKYLFVLAGASDDTLYSYNISVVPGGF